MASQQGAGTQRRLNAFGLSAAAVGAVCMLAWVILLLWQQSPPRSPFPHHSLGSGRGSARLALAFAADWLVMVLAMMLPTALPFLGRFQRQYGQYAGLAWRSAALLAGYVLSWCLFGIAIYAGYWLLYQQLLASVAPGAHLAMLAALPPLVAGAYQLTPLKRGYLESCTFAPGRADAHDARAAGGVRQAVLAGLHHGGCCIGCCWALMLLMFAVGAGSLGWMLVLAALMAIEKNVAWGRRLSTPLGLALLAWAAWLAATTP